jgi:parallel beta-helix repeat protein
LGSEVLNDRSIYPGLKNPLLIKKKMVAVGLSWSMIFVFIVISVGNVPSVKGAQTIYVDDVPGVGPGNPAEDYTTIAEAIQNANGGDTIFVYNGTYNDTGWGIIHQMNLIGEDRDGVSVDFGDGGAFKISADWVNISGFTLIGGHHFGGESSIFLDNANNCSIFGNNLLASLDGRWYGIEMKSSSYNTIMGNDISGFIDSGIYLELSSNYNSICNNSFYYNDLAIWLTGSTNNTIIDNMFTSNEYGLGLGSSNNMIYHNNFINNTYKPFDVYNNQWDNGYPSGGNFWSDYAGEDKYRGPNQDILGNDGIGDSNYTIDADSHDNYPLMSPYGGYYYLHEDWNLISIPRIQTATELDEVLSSITGSFKAVQWFNASDTSDPWKHNCTTKPTHLNDLNTIDHTMGFWIFITQPNGTLFKYLGKQPTSNQSIQLHKGWNMVGFPSLSTKNRTIALNNLEFGIEVDAIWTYNAATHKWKWMGPLDSFDMGIGYRVHATADCTWQVPL